MPIEQPCRHQVGFIFKGDCGNPADAFCNNCAKPVCRKHCRVNPGGLNCQQCSQELYDLDLDDSPSPDLHHSDSLRHSHSHSHSHSDDPYMYQHSSHSHSGSEHHSSEFSESDRSNFATESPADGGSSYEQDFSGS